MKVNNVQKKLKELFSSYSTVFSKQLGKIQGIQE